ncbi:TetR/AcrR family transcriptional regulator [Rhizorhabdus sp.]|jgi:AcrR family transcriptional regulator|uniref:TetR/AcrR family transcriptional regulator n=1 Tax=Rhizorhabdus sp. TaxID=1968843 RepID=UPI0012281FD1|nr:TetR/AcrR family transcriptional regulator [Rhizorhabdus sp.]MBD3761652.1 TetR/AcrR family transcriptional regulator [Rhizorhabdus sp.]TAK06290.1 MAG: TetR/AcrR family transcriptional regulator [Rhizorhabdus sp.]
MKTPKAVNKRVRILEAAAKVIAEKGYAAATMAEIGEAAGTFAGSLYYYFPSKDALVEALLNIGTTTVSEPVIASVAALPSQTGAYQKIKTALDKHVARMLEEDAFILAYWRLIDQVPSDMRERHRKHPRAYGDFWRGLMREGQAEGVLRSELDPNLAQLFLLGTTIYALDWYSPGGKLNPQAISDSLADMFFGGIASRDIELNRLAPQAKVNHRRKSGRPASDAMR